MSFITVTRDYIELLNNIYDSVSGNFLIPILIQKTIIYFFSSIKYLILYLLTFQWFRDLSYLPILIPQLTSEVMKEVYFLENPVKNLLTFLEIPAYKENKFLIGFLNSFFLALPISCSHLLFLRRLIIQGNIAGLAAGLGNIFGQCLFIFSVIFGVRFLIIPSVGLEPLNYLCGVVLLLTTIFDIVHERTIRLVDGRNKRLLLKIFILNFLLIWTEQSCIFQYLGNITFGPEPTILEVSSRGNSLDFLLTHINYLLGIFTGNLFFTFLLGFLLKQISTFLQVNLNFLRSTWIIRLNFSLLSLIVAFTFCSIPYYGLDYLFTGPVGFVSQDQAFKRTIFSTNEILDTVGFLTPKNSQMERNVTPFDRALYLLRFQPLPLSFESLNIGRENAVLTRIPSLDLNRRYREKVRRLRNQWFIKSESPATGNEAPKLNLYRRKKLKFTRYPKESYFRKKRSPIERYVSNNVWQRFDSNYNRFVSQTFELTMKGGFNTIYTRKYRYKVEFRLEDSLRRKYRSNGIYKFLLTFDIDNFLGRQPKSFLLSPKDERKLQKKRLLLSRYYDSLRFYKDIPYSPEFKFLFGGSKSYTDRVYNQQFIGTLNLVRRLYSIRGNQKAIPLKFDQPLFEKNYGKTSFQHEELKNKKKKRRKKRIPFLNLVESTPFYVGWDDQLRKLVITNRLLPRNIASYTETDSLATKKIQFTTWPIKRSTLRNQPEIPLRLMDKTKSQVESSGHKVIFLFYTDDKSNNPNIDYLPSNLLRLERPLLIDFLPPNRGGFIWPGTSKLKFSLNQIFQE